MFINTKGSSWNEVKRKLKIDSEISDKWILNEIFICTVTSPIRSRKEYCDLRGIDVNSPLWYDETKKGKLDNRIKKSKNKVWNEVFEFSVEKRLSNLNLNLHILSKENKKFHELVLSILNVFADSTSREISQEMYISFIEYILNVKNHEINNLLPYIENTHMQNDLKQLH
ncbi:hypothetical protein BHF71_10655 [Vulcanibacillus modesticaldus]|uniref:Uncharacterized protein n=1 Tax=Vulcanibacillus modesticaldus TaxID=337097 RepID=A0A1D2YT27_9BACI|nr:hypothetical protein [Vulcanibacillus modesticaldus]OEF98848.1 hypothetical protein BHF71_10655 [Vulcanibacillus modesticaldus]